MATWANVDRVWDNGFGGSRDGRKIEGGVFHHVAGTDGQRYVAEKNSRNSHPTYHVKNSGYLTGIVHPDRRPFSTAHTVDKVAITFEIDNESTGGEWPVSSKALSRAIDVCVYHAKEQGLKRFAKNKPGVDQPGVFFIAWHSQYHATACPGPYITEKLDWIVAECQRRLDGKTPSPTPTPTPTPRGYDASDFGIGTNPTASQWKTIQEWFKRLGRYSGPIDGVPGPNTWRGIQNTVAQYRYYDGPIDGVPGRNTARGIQLYASRGGGYTGPIDGILGPNSWAGFVRRLSS